MPRSVELIAQLLEPRKNESFDETVIRLRAVRELLHVELGRQIETPLNRELATFGYATLEEKRALSRWLNGELRSLGLAVQCPITGAAAIVKGVPGGDPSKGFFQLQLITGSTSRKSTFSSSQLFHVTVMPYSQRTTSWTARTMGTPGKKPPDRNA